MTNKRSVGTQKENIAAQYLISLGFRIVKLNYRVRQAEIDIIAMDGNTYVFVEVKYRTTDKFGNPLEAVDYRKQRQISKAAMQYVTMAKLSIYDTPIRFDVIGILDNEITHIKNAFEYRG